MLGTAAPRYTPQIAAADALFEARRFAYWFAPDTIRVAFEDDVARRSGRGLDRVDARAFQARLTENIDVIQRKVADGTYQFSPYLEQLRPKGRERPRVISLPTMRDRVVLMLLKEYLHEVFPDCVARGLPNTVIRELCTQLKRTQTGDLCVYRTDIRAFYDSIPHQPLFDALAARVPVPEAMTLLRRAIRTPTVPAHGRRADRGARPKTGVPQGLSVSNVLANIALQGFDQLAEGHGLARMRYVDDLLFLVRSAESTLVRDSVEASLRHIGLEANQEKTSCDQAGRPFSYLGYQIEWPRISVKRDNVDNYVRRMAGLFTGYRYAVRDARRVHWLTEEMLAARYLDEINLHITGAVSGGRRYGWLFFYLEINDTALLHRLDGVIQRLALRAPAFPRAAEVNSLVQAYYEARHRARGDYIFNYDTRHLGVTERREYLGSRGFVSPTELPRMTDQEVHHAFERIRARRLAALERDVGGFS